MTYDCFLNLNTSLTMSVENQYRYIRQQINWVDNLHTANLLIWRKNIVFSKYNQIYYAESLPCLRQTLWIILAFAFRLSCMYVDNNSIAWFWASTKLELDGFVKEICLSWNPAYSVGKQQNPSRTTKLLTALQD